MSFGPINQIYTPADSNLTMLVNSDGTYNSKNPAGDKGAAPSGVFFQSDFANDTLNETFVDVNKFGGVIVGLSSDYLFDGVQACKISYPVSEAGATLKVAAFPGTQSLFSRKREYYAPGWEGNWPLGLKTSRYFCQPNHTRTGDNPYMSEKLIYQTLGDTDSLYGLGMNNAISNLDLTIGYPAGTLFGNGLPYIRTGRWYTYETWIVLNSAPDVADGVMEIYIDGVNVYNNQAVVYRSTVRGTEGGAGGWESMWFGGNYSGSSFGEPDETVHRYIAEMYLSTTKDLL